MFIYRYCSGSSFRNLFCTWRRALTILSLALLIGAVPASAQTPAEIERELLGYLGDIKKYGSVLNPRLMSAEQLKQVNISLNQEQRDRANISLRKALTEYGKRSDVLSYTFPTLAQEMHIANSPDGRLRIYSWDLWEGGTMHFFDSVFQYRGASGALHTWSPEKMVELNGPTPYYHEIFETEGADGLIYLGVSESIGDSRCRSARISAFRILGERLDPAANVIKTHSGFTNSIVVQYDSFWDPEQSNVIFTYNKVDKSFNFPVVITEDGHLIGKVTDRMITYTFNGKHFRRNGRRRVGAVGRR